jgi:hypothetical protein
MDRTQAQRKQFVFVKKCGCPTAVRERTRSCRDEAAAWNQMYGTRAERLEAFRAGIEVRLVDHDTYSRIWYPLMLKTCTHRSPVRE